MIDPKIMRAANRRDTDWKNTMTLFKLLPHSKENAMHLKDLSSALRLTERKTKELVLAARLGHWNKSILSNQEGYWISENPTEIYDWCKAHSLSASKRFAVCQNLRLKADKLQGQMTIDDIQNGNINDDQAEAME